MSFLSRQRGFSLIELLVIASIIMLLSTIVLSSLDLQRKRARDAVRKTDIQFLRSALELYSVTNGQYPSDLQSLIGLEDINFLPTDPSSGQNYEYSRESAFSFQLYAILEGSGDDRCWVDDIANGKGEIDCDSITQP